MKEYDYEGSERYSENKNMALKVRRNTPKSEYDVLKGQMSILKSKNMALKVQRGVPKNKNIIE